MDTLNSSPPHHPLDGVTPQDLIDRAITAGADPHAVQTLRRTYQHPAFANLVRDLDAFSAELDGLTPTPKAPAPAAEPDADLAAPTPTPTTTSPGSTPAVEHTPAVPADAVHPILALWDAGFAGEVIPIRIGSNAPSLPRWQEAEVTREEVAGWACKGRAFGLRTRRFPCLDVDVLDAPLSAAVEDVITNIWGSVPKRVGLAPKAAFAFRADAPFKKIIIALRRDGTECGRVEVLADGQQYVISGQHPSGSAYTWSRSGRRGGVEMLADVGAAALPVLTPEDISDRFLPALVEKLTPMGIEATLSIRSGSSVSAVDQANLVAPNLAALQEVVAGIPNNEAVDRDGWIEVGIAIAAAGADWPAEAFEIWSGWCDKWTEGVNLPEQVQAAWESFKPPFQLGFDFLKSRSTTAAKYDFEAIVTPQITPLPTEGQRIAALTHDAEAAFLLEALQFRGDLGARWDTLTAAAAATDPLAEVFGQLVFPAAQRAPMVTDAAFRFAIHNTLANEPRWLRLQTAEQGLLQKAALALLQRADRRTDQRSPSPIRDLQPRSYLVDHLLPKESLVAIVGAPGQGKSWVALELAALIGGESKRPFAGLAVNTHAPVWYMASEDEHGLHDRRLAWEAVHGLASNLHLFAGVPLLSGPLADSIRFFRDAARHGGAPALIVIDVFTDTVVGDENSVQTVGPSLYRAKVLGRLTGATMLIVHHASKARPEDARGSSAFNGAMDVIGSVVSDERGIRLKVVKHRSAPAGAEYRFHLRDGVLQTGADPRTGDPLLGGSRQLDQDARLVADALRGIAGVGDPATNAELQAALATECRGMGSDDPKNRSTASSRRSRAIHHAIQLQYVTVTGRGRSRLYSPGPMAPPLEAADLSRETP